MISPQQYRKLMKQSQSENHIGQSGIKARTDLKMESLTLPTYLGRPLPG
jgi:hypothetical protein